MHANPLILLVSNLYNILIQVNRSKHSINETQVLEQRVFSFGIKEQLLVRLQNVDYVEQKSAPALQRRLFIACYNYMLRDI